MRITRHLRFCQPYWLRIEYSGMLRRVGW